MLPAEITDNAALHRFELHAQGETAGAVLRFAQENNLNVVPLCPFVAQYMKRHPEYSTIVDPPHRWMVESAQ
jgi:hypothetical protein